MNRETVVVLDFGGQYNQLIARRVRECNVYCEIYSYKTDIEKIKAMQPKGIIFTGGPNSCYTADAPTYTKEIFELGVPVLGICYGAQLMMHLLGGKVEKAPVREYGKIEVSNKAINDIADLALDSIDEVYPYKKENNCVCSFKDDELRVTVLIKVKQGCDVVKKCNLLQSKIKEAIAGMTGIECKSVDIDIQGFVTEK